MSENPIYPTKPFIAVAEKRRALSWLSLGAGLAALLLGLFFQFALLAGGIVVAPRRRGGWIPLLPSMIGLAVLLLCMFLAGLVLRCPACGRPLGRGKFCASCGVQLKE